MAAAESERAGFSMGEHTLFVPIELFAHNRHRICQRLRSDTNVPKNSCIVLQGGESVNLYNTDVDYNIFRQEPYFHWMFGVKEPGCYAAVDVETEKTVLFVPHLPESYGVWMGQLLSLDDFRKIYSVDEVHYLEDMAPVLISLKPSLLLTLSGENTDSGLSCLGAVFKGASEFKVNDKVLFPEISDCRVTKSEMELEVMRYVNRISSEAHIQVMRMIRSGMTEYQAEAMFCNYVYLVGGCRHVSYTCICGSGHNSSILHYGHAAAPNNKLIFDGDMCLFDMGANYFGYASDITVSFPVNGKFTEDQAIVYNAVLKANQAVMNTAKPGVSWVDMHYLANRTMLSELKNAGLLRGDVDEMMKAELAAVFQPHGLGHLMGLDVHDVGAYLPGRTPERPTRKSASKLRTARILEKGMVLTIEPGCYFIDVLLDEALANPDTAKFMVPEVIERFRKSGGVRIEDDVVVTENGVENMTKVPRTIEEIEAAMADKVEAVPAAPVNKGCSCRR